MFWLGTALAVTLFAPAPARPLPSGTRAVQERLSELGFLPPSAVDGRTGPRTANAVVAFQKWRGLERDGEAGQDTRAALTTATRPRPALHRGAGRRIEVLLRRQVLLAIRDDRVVRIVPVSTGAAATPTPAGEFRVQAKVERWWSNPFHEWLSWALPFNGGIAIHEFADVPPQPASHGCVRVPAPDAQWLFGFVSAGDEVSVVG
jgi:lipoprotein-anchoring transpeptidase ErfK/SrfK